MKYILLVLIALDSFASPITIEFIDELERSQYKDYYIWRYLGQNITPTQARRAFEQTNRVNNKILYRYAKKSDDKYLVKDVECIKTDIDNITDLKEADCISLALTPYKATKLSSSALKQILIKLKKSYPKEALLYKAIASSSPFSELLLEDEEIFLKLFNSVGSKYRREHFNIKLPAKFIKKLISHKEFNRSIKLITTDYSLDIIAKSILEIDSTNLTHHSNFFLALNALRYKNNKLSLKYLKIAKKKAWDKMDIDKVSFWQYQITKEIKYIDELNNSWAMNFYVIYANLKSKKPFKNVYPDIKVSHGKTTFNIANPFDWLKELKNAKNIDFKQMQHYKEVFATNELKPHLAFMETRYSKYKKHYLLRPFEDIIANESKHRKALIYALARQESRFIPAVISSSYAMGVMQIMPFLSKHLSQQLKEPLKDLDEMLDRKKSVRFANKHLDFLEHRLKNPLFIAYAYNGGIGFTRRYLKNGKFVAHNDYEPFMSMEMMGNSQSREYGKKVLANYILYRALDTEPIDFKVLIDSLVSPYQDF